MALRFLIPASGAALGALLFTVSFSLGLVGVFAGLIIGFAGIFLLNWCNAVSRDRQVPQLISDAHRELEDAIEQGLERRRQANNALVNEVLNTQDVFHETNRRTEAVYQDALQRIDEERQLNATVTNPAGTDHLNDKTNEYEFKPLRSREQHREAAVLAGEQIERRTQSLIDQSLTPY